MMNYVHRGNSLTITAPYNVLSGGGVKVGNLFGVAVNTQNAGDSMEAQVAGVFDLVKDGSTFNAGDLVYWDDVNKVGTSTVGTNLLIGLAELAQLTGDATVRVKLFGVPGFSGQANGLRVAHAVFDVSVDGTGTGTITPANSDTIPQDAILLGGVVNAPTAFTSADGTATVAIGVAGSAGNCILTATLPAALTADAVLKPTCATTPAKITAAAGKINVTVAVEALVTGKLEVWVTYVLGSYA
jgi:predicted RecA/RadA family phage recombinase